MTPSELGALQSKANSSYAAHIDLRQLKQLCDAVEQLTWLRAALLDAIQYLTINDEQERFLDLVRPITAHMEQP